jgi:hypothetical protein
LLRCSPGWPRWRGLFGLKVGNIDWEKRFEAMPDNSPAEVDVPQHHRHP